MTGQPIAFPDATDYRELMLFLMHELRRIQHELQGRATDLSEGIKNKLDEPKVRASAEKILDETMVLSSWLSIVDFYLDPVQFLREPKSRHDLGKLFHRAILLFHHRSRHSRTTIKLSGERDLWFEGFRVISVLPLILLDNALKYSPSGSQVQVLISAINGKAEATVTSIGPHVEPEELTRLGEPSFRGALAKQITQVGNGQGLMLAKAICELHGGTIDFTTGDHPYMVNGLPYAEFTATVRLPAC